MNIEEVLEFTKNFYIEKKRKGIDKSYFEHMLDVAENTSKYIEFIEDENVKTSLLIAALLHDILEDSKYTPDEIQQILNLDNNTLTLIKILSRNYNDNYIQNICCFEYALIIKLSDRISNLIDLLEWIKIEGVNKHNDKIFKKYLQENQEMYAYILEHEDVYMFSEDSPVNQQIQLIKELEYQIVILNN